MIPSVGVDVSKDHLDWAASAESAVERVPNHAAGIRRLVEILRKLQPERIVVEATGGYERALVDASVRAGLPVVVVNPWRVRRFGEGLGVLAKTDRIDAQLLALFGERARPPIRSMARGPEAALLARRRQLVEVLVAERNRVGMAAPPVRSEIASLIRILERRIARLDQQIDGLLEADPERQETAAILQSTPSVGPGVARSLLVDLPELGRLSRQQIASLVGLAPFARDSGRTRGQRSVRAGRAAPRTALYLAAMNGSRFNPVLRAFYERLRAAGKPPKLAFVALARKLLTILNAMVRNRTTWRSAPLQV
jgi:transposase